MIIKTFGAAVICACLLSGCYVKRVEKKETTEPQKETVIHEHSSAPDVVIHENDPYRRRSTTVTY